MLFRPGRVGGRVGGRGGCGRIGGAGGRISTAGFGLEHREDDHAFTDVVGIVEDCIGAVGSGVFQLERIRNRNDIKVRAKGAYCQSGYSTTALSLAEI